MHIWPDTTIGLTERLPAGPSLSTLRPLLPTCRAWAHTEQGYDVWPCCLVRVADLHVNFFYWRIQNGEKVDRGGATLGFLGLEIVKVALKFDPAGGVTGVAYRGPQGSHRKG